MERMQQHVCALDWHLVEETQQEAIEWLVKYIPREQLSLLLSPHTEKSCWQNAVQVVARIGYTENEAALPHLVELFQDLNWPGAQEAEDVKTDSYKGRCRFYVVINERISRKYNKLDASLEGTIDYIQTQRRLYHLLALLKGFTKHFAR